MIERNEPDEMQQGEPDPWPHEPPAELIAALDHAAARLSELDARGVQISLGICSDGSPRTSVSAEGFRSEISSLSLLKLVCGSKLEETPAAIAS